MADCIGPACDKQLKDGIVACAKHWFMLPRELRRDIARAWRQIQNGDDEARDAHRELTVQAVEFFKQ